MRLHALKESPEAFGSSYEEELEYGEDVWKSRLPNALFAVIGDKPVGMAGYLVSSNIKENHVASIFSVYVMEDYRRAGIAEKLMDFIMGELRSRGNVIKITLGVIASEEAAVSLYRKMGFQVAGTLRKQLRIGEEFHDEQLMELLL